MFPPAVTESFHILATHLTMTGADEARPTLLAYWRGDRAALDSPQVRTAADVLDRALPTLTRSNSGTNELAQLFDEPHGEALIAWCEGNAARRDARLAPLLAHAQQRESVRTRARAVMRDRIIEGPLLDALACAPLLGAEALFRDESSRQVRARLEILLWEAGASALQLPELGAWLWGSEHMFNALVGYPARGPLRGRVLAARCLEVCARGMPATAPPELVGRTLQVLQPLILHPEPLVWVHASRALGRLAGVIDMLEGTLLDWLRSESPLLRQRAITAFASQPAEKLKMFSGELVSLIDNPKAEAWVLAAVAAATPHLYAERKDLWDKLAARIVAGDGGAITARALARGLAALWRRGTNQSLIEPSLRQLRETARVAKTHSLEEQRRWLEVIAVTDPIDGAERDPLDLERGLENLVRLGAQYDDEEADNRAARFADSLGVTFVEARKVALSDRNMRHRAAGITAVEGIARSLALALWGPLLSTRPAGDPIPEPSLEETWSLVANAPQELIELVAERRATIIDDEVEEQNVALEVLAIRLGGYALDACGEEPTLGSGRGPTAHQVCLWLRKLDGLADGSRDLPAPLRTSLSALLWRLVDTTRGTALGEVDDVEWLGPFAAWWALVIDRPAMLQQLGGTLPLLGSGAIDRCCALADQLRAALAADPARACEGQWLPAVAAALEQLHAEKTELARALDGFAQTLAGFATASGKQADLETECHHLVLAAERLHAALEDPVKGLHSSDEEEAYVSEGAHRVAALIARAIRVRDLSTVSVWFGALGPVTSALVEAAANAAVKRTPPPPPAPKKVEPKVIEGYELMKPLGEGGIGSVWLVRKQGGERFFVLKMPKADALAEADENEREGILTSFNEEARALAGLYHPNVANIIDRGVSNGSPFLVLELLIGADLKQYASARLMSLFELRQVVPEACAGLAALHGAGLVHRDVKPANLWLRLPLQGGERFDPKVHRDPARAMPLSTVVIDFGMVRAMKVAPEAAGRFVAGTAGYIAPEQVLDPLELTGQADVYALAGTIYNVTTGRTFFDDIQSARDRILAHMQRDPFEDPARIQGYPAPLAKLLRAATAKNPADRPNALEFGRAFAQLF